MEERAGRRKLIFGGFIEQYTVPWLRTVSLLPPLFLPRNNKANQP